MRLRRGLRRFITRALATLAALGGLLAALGWPAPPSARRSGEAYPCQARACGCVSAEKCWAGDCCCFTLEEKLAWADARGIEVPGHVRPLVARRASRPSRPKCPACERAKPSQSPRWVIGVQNEKCRNKGPGASPETGDLFASTPPRPRLIGATPEVFNASGDDRPTSVDHFPTTPPPRRA